MSDVYGNDANMGDLMSAGNEFFDTSDMGFMDQSYLKDREVKIDTSMVMPLNTKGQQPASIGFQPKPRMPEGYVNTFYNPHKAYSQPAPKVYFQ